MKATSKPKTARFELLQIQQRLWRRLQREIKATIADNPPNVEIYKEEYERDLRRYDSISSKEDLVRACKAARVVYLGDYHTLPQAQKTLVKLLLALCGTRKEIVLCMEMVHIKHQEHLDAYMERRLDDKGFLAAIDYEGTWGFPWQPYREIFAVARRRKLRVVGINSDPQEHEHDHLLERDFRTAKVVATHLDANPNALVIVFDGDLHVARDHLPFIVANYVEYELRKDAPKQVIIHQNAEAVYWRLAEERREREINVVRLSDDSFCVLNASPIEKLHSYMNWVMERDALQPLVESSWGLIEDDEDWEDDNDLEYSEQVHNLVTSVADFLEIKRDDLDSFHVFTVNDLDFLDSITFTYTFGGTAGPVLVMFNLDGNKNFVEDAVTRERLAVGPSVAVNVWRGLSISGRLQGEVWSRNATQGVSFGFGVSYQRPNQHTRADEAEFADAGDESP